MSEITRPTKARLNPELPYPNWDRPIPVDKGSTLAVLARLLLILLGATIVLIMSFNAIRLNQTSIKSASLACQRMAAERLNPSETVGFPLGLGTRVDCVAGRQCTVHDTIQVQNSDGALTLIDYTCTVLNRGAGYWQLQSFKTDP
jgi:hypothetical protein